MALSNWSLVIIDWSDQADVKMESAQNIPQVVPSTRQSFS
jgi:hypothetical protein